MKTRNLTIVLLVVGAILSVPLIGMQFSNEIDWKLFDFIIMGILLFATGMAIEFSLRRFSSTNRLVAIGAILLVFFLIWAELAVGIFGTPFAGS